MKRRCANIGGTLQPITSPLTVFARDDLFTNKSHPRRKSEGRSKIERVPSGPMQIYPPLYPTHSPEWQRYTIHTDSFFRGQVWKFNIFRQAVRSGVFTRGNHEDVWENMYGDARGILTGGGKGNFVILWFPGFHEFEWNRVVRQDKSCSCAIFKLRLKLKFFFLSLSLFYISFRFSCSFLFQILRLKFIFVGNSKSKFRFFNLGSLSTFFSKFCREINGKESTSGNLF